MINLIISKAVLDKILARHKVTEREIEQCFHNITGGFLEDDREQHKTIPPTLWFVSTTNTGRVLKVIFVRKGGKIHLKSCYEPTLQVIDIYNQLA